MLMPSCRWFIVERLIIITLRTFSILFFIDISSDFLLYNMRHVIRYDAVCSSLLLFAYAMIFRYAYRMMFAAAVMPCYFCLMLFTRAPAAVLIDTLCAFIEDKIRFHLFSSSLPKAC